jgi:2-polyprenyl-3-methyl-5-hydroxy-6-metoxy-1,4-benzoquinol methylase
MTKQKLFRDSNGNVKEMLSIHQGYTFSENPFDFFIILARYKFASKILQDKNNVLDIGCGHGFGSAFLSSVIKTKLTAVDIDEDLVKYSALSHSKSNIDFKTFNLLDYDLKYKEKFDGICSMDVIEHFEYEKIDFVIDQYANLLVQGGVAVIGTPNKNSNQYASKRRKESHPFEFEYKDYKEKLSKSFSNVFIFSMTDEVVSTSFPELAWYHMAVCIK